MSEEIDKYISLNWENIYKYTRNDKEYTFIDKAEVIPGKSAKGIKLVSGQDWYFRIHLPNDPIFPGVFIMEAIMTTGAFTLYTQNKFEDCKFIFDSASNVKIYKDVRPGDAMICYSTLVSYKRGLAKLNGSAYVDDKKVCDMEYVLVEPNIIRKIMKK